MKPFLASLLASTTVLTFATSASAQLNVGASSTNNLNIATATGAVYLFDENNGKLTNNAKIIGKGAGDSTLEVASGLSTTTLDNRGQVRADNSNGIAVNSVRTIDNFGQIRSNSGKAVYSETNNNFFFNRNGAKITSGGSHAVHVASNVSNSLLFNQNRGIIEATGPNGIAIEGVKSINNDGKIRSLDGTAIKMNVAGSLVTNTANGVISAYGDGSVAIDSAEEVRNFGTIYSSAGTGILATTDNAQITNNTGGKITSAAVNGAAIFVTSGASNTNLINDGQVRALGTNGTAVAGIQTLTNSGTIRSLSGTGVYVASGLGSIDNQTGGKIIGGNYAIQVASGVSDTTVTNDGIIEARGTNGTAIDVASGVSTIDNTHLIRSLSGTAIHIASGVGSITNGSSGKIASGGSHVINIASNVSSSTITNAGLIEASGSNGIAIAVASGVSNITNSGTIRSLSGTAIEVASGISTINNEADGLIQSQATNGIAIDNSLNNGAMLINNAGDIRGDIKFGSGEDTLNITGGKIVGNIIGQNNNDTVNFNANAFRTRGQLSGIKEINVNSGLLVLDHAVTGNGSVNIFEGARVVANHGSIDSNTLTNQGVLELKADKYLNIFGNYIQGPEGTLRTHVDNTSNGKLFATGITAFNDGTTIDTRFADGRAVSDGETFDVVDTITLLVNPDQLNLTSNNAFVSLDASKDGNKLVLTASTAPTPAAISNVLGNAGIESPQQLRAIAGGGDAGVNAEQSLAGFSGMMTELQNTNPAEFQRINSQFGSLDGGAAVQAISNIKPNAAAMAGASAAVFTATNSGNTIVTSRLNQARVMQETQLAGGDWSLAFHDREFGDDLQVWAQPFLSNVNRGQHRGISGFDANSYGILMGADVGISPKARIGASLGYGQTEVTLRSNGLDGADIDTYQASLYGTYLVNENFYLDGILGLGFNEYETNETVAFLGTQTNADYDGMQYNARIGAGYDIHTPSGFVITPNAFVQYTHLSQDAYTTTGTGVNRRTEETDTNSVVTSAGVKLAYPHKIEAGTLVPYVRGSYLYEGGDNEQTVTSTFVGGGGSFTTTSPTVSRDAIHMGGGIDFHSTSDLRVGANVDYTTRNEQNALSGALRIRMPF